MLNVFLKLEVKVYNNGINHFENENNHCVTVNVYLLRKKTQSKL